MPSARWLPLLLPLACAGDPVESTSASSAADESADDDDATSNASDASLTGDPSTDPTTDATADSSTSIDPDGASDPTTDGDSATTGGSADTTAAGTDTGDEDCHPVLDEIAFDVDMMDNGYEWVALHNPCNGVVMLDDVVLAWGGDDYTYGRLQLSGMMTPGECLVVGGPEVDAKNHEPELGLAVDLDPDLQNADPDGDADAIGLFAGLVADVTATSVPFDAVIYGEVNGSDLLDETGRPGVVDVAAGSDVETLARLPGTDTWVVNATPSPNACGTPDA